MSKPKTVHLGDRIAEERDLSQVTVPRQPSNRSVFEQMLRWGWTEGNSDGKWVSMYGPPIGETDGVRLRIRPATQHDANPATVFRDIYRLTTNGDPRLFWAGPGDMHRQIISMALAEKEAQSKRIEEEKIAKAAARAERQAAEEAARRAREAVKVTVTTPTPAIQPTEPEQEQPMTATTKGRVLDSFPASKVVLGVLAEFDRPTTVRELLIHFGYPTNADYTNAMSGRCSYLVSKGLATRVMYGSYRVANNASAISARVQHQVDPASPQTPPAAPAAPAAPAQIAPPSVSPTVAAESIDDTIEAVLDLLLPSGFKASHLRYIAPWVETTKRMVEEVTRG
jgi:hypothetical protein